MDHFLPKLVISIHVIAVTIDGCPIKRTNHNLDSLGFTLKCITKFYHCLHHTSENHWEVIAFCTASDVHFILPLSWVVV